MTDPWDRLQSSATDALNWLWDGLAKEGKESALLAPLAQYPTAAGWLASSMALSTDYVTRKLGAMLAGWIDDANQKHLLKEMLDNERTVFAEDPMTANSVGEDIMFAATRWSQRAPGDVRESGIGVLAAMIADALHGTPWNTVHWATANLHAATSVEHEILSQLQSATQEQLDGQQFLINAVEALRSDDKATLAGYVTAPPSLRELSPEDPNYAVADELWAACAAAEKSLG